MKVVPVELMSRVEAISKHALAKVRVGVVFSANIPACRLTFVV